MALKSLLTPNEIWLFSKASLHAHDELAAGHTGVEFLQDLLHFSISHHPT
jgi:hypothetical protein